MSRWVAFDAIAGSLAAYWLVTALWEFWQRHKGAWWRRTDGDYLDLRPRSLRKW